MSHRLIVLLAFIFLASIARAEQFVLFNVTFTFTQEEALNSKPSQSHYYLKDDRLNPKRPKDWTSPFDYRNGRDLNDGETQESIYILCYFINRV